MGGLLQDFRYSYRLFLKTPGFVTAALLSLALAIGANTTIFSVLNAVLLRPFPVRDPGRLAVMFENNRQLDDIRAPTYTAFSQWKQRSRAFENMALGDLDGGGPATLTSAKEAIRVRVGAISADFFSVVGVAPVIGRGFTPEDSPPGQGHAIVLSHKFWQRQFKGDKNILGESVAVEGEKAAIIGVMPAGFWYLPWGKDTDLWYVFNPSVNPTSRWLMPFGRLRAGATPQQAQAELDTLFQNLKQDQPEVNKGWGIRVESLHEWAVGGSRSTLYLLLGTVGFVLLIGCANVANLLLAHANARGKEFAVRASLGAGRLRLVRQLLTESVALSLAGGFLGVLVAYLGTNVFVALAPEWFGITNLRIDSTVLVFTCALSLLTGILFGLMPALQGSQPDLNESLKQAGGRSGGSRSRGRSALVVSEVALALLLLMGAGLMINSFIRLQRVDLGFNPKNILKAEIFLAGPKYWNNAGGDMKRVTPQGDDFFRQLVERAEHLPGVLSAGIGSLARMSPYKFRIAGKPTPAGKDLPRIAFTEVSPGYFRTLGIQLERGRLLVDEFEGAPWTVVVSDAFVRRYFPQEDPIGKILYMTMPSFGSGPDIEDAHPREIVGIVRDVKYWGPRNQAPLTVYASYRQHPWDYPGGSYSFHLWTTLVLHTGVAPTSLVHAIEHTVAKLDKDQVVFDIMPLERMISTFVAPQRFWMRLFSIFGGLALLLAIVGIYGVMSYSVSRRTHEIGIRMANGAQQSDILKLVLGQALKLALAGVLIGIVVSLASTRLIKGYLYEVKPTDPLTFLVVGLILIAVAIGASYIPARRAMNVDPTVALRYE
jgi:putative ABC transport system permease protein